MKDNSEIPLYGNQQRCRVLIFAIVDNHNQQYEEISKGYVELGADEDQQNCTFHYMEVKDQKTNEVLMRSNLKLQKNFGKQKGSIISWTDDQQPQYSQIALSFEKQKQCDHFWRTICQKIGKSYLQISGSEKMQIPTSNNLNYLLQKAHNSIDLIDYNIVHSSSLMQGLKKVFYEMKHNKDEMGMGVISRIINAILSPEYSSRAIETLFKRDNFQLILDIQQYKKGISFYQIYQQKVGQFLKNTFKLPQQIFDKIELSHRAVFYRQNVINFLIEPQLQSMMLMINRQAQVQIMSYLNRQKVLQKIITFNQYQTQKIINLTFCKMNFIIESLLMYQQLTSEHLKTSFKENIYQSGLISFTKNLIQSNNVQALQLLYLIVDIDRLRFFQFFVNDFKQSSTDNLLKTLLKKYIHENTMRASILCLIQAFIPIFNLKRDYLEFFNGTFMCSVFSVAKQPKCILALANVLLGQLQNSSILFNQLIKLKVFQKLATQYRGGNKLRSKPEELEMVKLLKNIIIEQYSKKQLKNKQIQTNIVQSGFFQCCMMIYLKNSRRYNIISSSMLQNLKLIQRIQYSILDQYLIKQYWQNEIMSKMLIRIKQKHIQHINQLKSQQKQQQYTQIQQHFHQQILQNQQQQSYLMTQQTQPITQIIPQTQSIDQKVSTNSKKQYLKYLKRMMSQLSQDRDEEHKQVRKIVNKTVQIQQVPMFQFDLPDMNELEEHT